MREQLRDNLLKLLDLERSAEKCLRDNGRPYTQKLYGKEAMRCCYSGDCPAQKEDGAYRPLCKLYLPEEENGVR